VSTISRFNQKSASRSSLFSKTAKRHVLP